MGMQDISFEEALHAILNSIRPLPPIEGTIENVVGRVLSRDHVAVVDCPSADISLRDGFAVLSSDLMNASKGHPVPLKCLGKLEAGSQSFFELRPGRCVEVLTGARIPQGADAVISVEFASRQNELVWCFEKVKEGKNILPKGSELKAGELAARAGTVVTPPVAGLLAAAGIHRAAVYPCPAVAIIATGDELVRPGKPLQVGDVYASNLVTLVAWTKRLGMASQAQIVPDSKDKIRSAIERSFPKTEVIVTSGGTWKSERDLMSSVLNELGWDKVFHRIRMWPGKGTCMGMLKGKPVFCLPGSPSATETVFLTLVLPALLAMAGIQKAPFPEIEARLNKDMAGEKGWTLFYQARLLPQGNEMWVEPLNYMSRLRAMAESQAIIQLPPGRDAFNKGDPVRCLLIT
jgi:molybdopterin molybdotransferase